MVTQRIAHKTTPQGREAPLWGAAEGCAFDVCVHLLLEVISALGRAHIHQACHIQPELTVPWTGPKATWCI